MGGSFGGVGIVRKSFADGLRKSSCRWVGRAECAFRVRQRDKEAPQR
jgi:hypothetical protein